MKLKEELACSTIFVMKLKEELACSIVFVMKLKSRGAVEGVDELD
jgi:hypothetical protein